MENWSSKRNRSMGCFEHNIVALYSKFDLPNTDDSIDCDDWFLSLIHKCAPSENIWVSRSTLVTSLYATANFVQAMM